MAFNEYMSKISTLLKNSDHVAPALILYPNRSIWHHLSPNGNREIKKIEEVFESISMILLQNQIDFDYINEDLLAKAKIMERKICIKDAENDRILEKFEILFLPRCSVITDKTKEFILQCAAQNIPVIFLDAIPEMTTDFEADTRMQENFKELIKRKALHYFVTPVPWMDSIRSSELAVKIKTLFSHHVHINYGNTDDQGTILVTHWRRGENDYYFVVNTVSRPISTFTLLIKDQRTPYKVDWDSDHWVPIHSRNKDRQYQEIPIQLLACESLLLSFPKGVKHNLIERTKPSHCITLPDEWVTKRLKSNIMVLRDWKLFTDCQHTGLRYVDRYLYESSFYNQSYQGDLRIAIEGDLLHQNGIQIYLNDVPIPLSSFSSGERLDPFICEAKVTSLIKTGENKLVIEHLEDGTSEMKPLGGPAYLLGDFILKPKEDQYILYNENKSLSQGSWHIQGYPYYSGGVVYSQEIDFSNANHAGEILLQLHGISECAALIINGQKIKDLLWPPYSVRIDPFLKEGKNMIDIVIYNTLHNTFVAPECNSGLLEKVSLSYITE